MPGICRSQTDNAVTGHKCGVFASAFSMCKSVFANGIKVNRRGDFLMPHTILVPGKPPKCVPHLASINSGSFNVFAEGVPVAMKGSSADAGMMVQGSKDVFINGAGGGFL